MKEMQRALGFLMFVLLVGGTAWYALRSPVTLQPSHQDIDDPSLNSILQHLDLYEQLGELSYSATEADWKWLLATDAEIQTGAVHP